VEENVLNGFDDDEENLKAIGEAGHQARRRLIESKRETTRART